MKRKGAPRAAGGIGFSLSGRAQLASLPLALLALTLLASANSFTGGFILDNRGLLLNDPRLRAATPENLALILNHSYWWPNGESGLYRPFTTLTYLFNYSILGNADHPAGYHAINFLLHAANVLLAWAIAQRLTRARPAAFFIAALWAVHPILTESVTNMVGRADLLAAGSVLAAFLLYLKYLEEESPTRRAACLAALSLVAALGIASKESAVILPVPILIYDLAIRRTRPRLAPYLATLIPIALVLWQRHTVLAATAPMEIPFTDNPLVAAHFPVTWLTALHVIDRYFALILWPAHLSADYSWAQLPLATGSPLDWALALAALALLPATVFLYRWNRPAFLFFCIGLAWLAPVSNLLFPTGTIMAERFLYLPALGVAACLVPAVFQLAPKYAPPLLALLAIALTARTLVRNADWHDDLSIATATVRTSPQSFKPHDLLAKVLFVADPTHSNLDQVVAESDKTLAILAPLPDDRQPPDPWLLAATCYMIRGDYARAIPDLRRYLAAAAPPRRAEAWQLLANAYERANDPTHGIEAATNARDLNPTDPKNYLQLAAINAQSGKLDEAAVALIEGAFVTGDPAPRRALVDLYQNAMDPRSCALLQGKAINPDCPIVHEEVCKAAPEVLALLKDHPETAQTRQKMFTNQFHCVGQALPPARLYTPPVP